MSEMNAGTPSQEDIELLLPWFVSGKLDEADKRLVEGFLVAHPEMRAQLDLAAAEQTEVTASNEAIAPPSADLLGKLMAKVVHDSTGASPLARAAGYVQRALDWLSDRSALVPLAAAAAVAIVLQAGALGALVWHGQEARAFRTASVPVTAAGEKGSYAIASFQPVATAQQIEQTLAPLGITIADGPKSGGIYRLRLANKVLGDTERDMLLTALKASSGVVKFVAAETQ